MVTNKSMATSSTAEALPVWDLAPYLENSTAAEMESFCKEVTEALKRDGCLLIRDPRCSEQDNTAFVDMLARYWAQPTSDIMRDTRPEYFYQIGPQSGEVPRATHDSQLQKLLRSYPAGHEAVQPIARDLKWRFYWRYGERDPTSRYAEIDLSPVVPASFPDWSNNMNRWGKKMRDALDSIAGILARGLDLPESTFIDRMKFAPHLLAPTGSNLKAHAVGAVLAGFHYDLNLFTIHGSPNFGGLRAWRPDGSRIEIDALPPGVLLVQPGKQFEYFTGGHIAASMHEVVVTGSAKAKAETEAARNNGWRVSSTFFAYANWDGSLTPLGHYATMEALAKYPPMPVGQQVGNELSEITKQAKRDKKGVRPKNWSSKDDENFYQDDQVDEFLAAKGVEKSRICRLS